MTAEDLAALIAAYAKAAGLPCAMVGRDRFRAAHRHLPWGREVNRTWTEAKSLASAGEYPTTPVEPLPPGHRIKGVSSFIGADGEIKGQWVKTESKEERLEVLIARLIAELPSKVPGRTELVPPPVEALDADLMACVVLGDGHVGLCSWEPETGANWDLKIAEDVHKAAVADLVSRGPNAETGMLIELGDWLDSDGVNNTTTAGTPQDTDTRWAMVVEVGLRIMVHGVDCMLAKHKSVIVDIIPGNHSRSAATIFQHYVAAWYRNESRVTVVTNPASRHYHEFGSCMIGTAHGDDAKPAELPSIMAAEASAMWGRTKHRRFFIGHVHHSAAIEHRGCVVESFRTLSPRSAWASKRGYVSKRDASRITFHRLFGEVNREICSVEYLMAAKGITA